MQSSAHKAQGKLVPDLLDFGEVEPERRVDPLQDLAGREELGVLSHCSCTATPLRLSLRVSLRGQ